MRISDTYQNNKIHQYGFSLIELSVVLVIMGAVAAMVIPNLSKVYSSITDKIVRDSILEAVTSASHYAYVSGQPLNMRAFIINKVELPEQWSITTDAPIPVTGNGFCHGGRLHIVSPNKLESFTLTRPFCVPDA